MSVELIYTKNTEHLAAYISRECLFQMYPTNVRVFSNSEMIVSMPKSFQNVVVLVSTINNDDWIKLFLILDALKTAEKIILCMPYVGYARQNHCVANESCASALLCRLLENFENIAQCIFVDTHGELFAKFPVEYVSMGQRFADDIKVRYANYVIVSPDFGGITRAHNVSALLQVPLVVCSKTKDILGKLRRVDIIGNVANKTCIIVDDLVDSGTTLRYVSEKLCENGAERVIAYTTHCLPSGNCLECLEKSNIDEVVFSDTLPTELTSEKFRVIPAGSLIVDAIRGTLP